MPLVGDSARIHIVSPSPNDGDAYLDFVFQPVANGGAAPMTDADLIDLADRFLASDYIQNQTWGSTAAVDTIQVPSARTVYP